MPGEILKVKELRTAFFTSDGVITAVDGVSFSIEEGKTLCIVGESGCGKSVTALSIMQLVPKPPGRIVGGEILFEGENLLEKSEREMQEIRGNKISMIFQEPMTSLNPVFTIGFQISEALKLHQNMNARRATERTLELLRLVGIPAPERRIKEYPHQLSGGMRQRVMIAMALACNPRLLIADEPTTALDVTIQAQILDLMKKLQRDLGTSILLITHDMGVVADMADRVVVMYAGKLVEEGDVTSLFENPLHPYTSGLLNSIPRVDIKAGRLHVIPGVVPDPSHMPTGCRFHPRCPEAMDRCKEKEPPVVDVGEGRRVRCWLRLSQEKAVGEVSQ